MRKAATIRDVAHAAAVSTATVSKFVNGGQRFSREVEARITAAIQQLGYRTNPLARGMITGRTGNLGIVIMDIRNPHFTSFVKGASRAAAEAGMNLLFADAAESRAPELALLQALLPQVDGLIVSARMPVAVVEWLREWARKPVVFYGGLAPRPGLHSVGCDNHASGLMLGRHLRELGHRRISYVGFGAAPWSKDRWEGLRAAFQGTKASLQCFDVPAPVAEEGERIASSVLLDAQTPEAVVAYNDLLALGLMAEARALGFRVPQQVSIAGFDNIAYGRYTTPSLTSVDTGSEATGEAAARHLLGLLAGESDLALHETIATRLVPRDSTAARGSGSGKP
ncbi:LacI family transcriptional regulator [Ramlibacter rhizophilus]|uniref:LacI family transcriptional regulator n=1 Tax=Ramlibacter rhizophilus TaxID=1781167 RepID=A0A4Z0C0F4_9BURK|nr:LacI family transcriptional regulator [Ramlibacter rhizophilus]